VRAISPIGAGLLCALLAVSLFVALLAKGARQLQTESDSNGRISRAGVTGSVRFAGSASRARAGLPRVVFWAWERPEDLRFLAPDEAAVAFLAKTIYLRAAAPHPVSAEAAYTEPVFTTRPRLQPLRITPGTPLIAVVRIENPGSTPAWGAGTPGRVAGYAAPSTSERVRLASEIAELQFIPGVSALQIDFDAPASAHSFYAALLRDVRGKLPAELPLSITALASWCIGDRWLEHLPPGTIDEAVPMLFRMGPGAGDVVRFLGTAEEFPVRACSSSLGVTTDEPFSKALLGRMTAAKAIRTEGKRVYVFSPAAWIAAKAEEIFKELQ
jgi:hypothetical protein